MMMRRLNDITDKNPFKVPEDYFENLSGRIMTETAGQKPEQVKISFLKKVKPFLAMAAAVAGLIIISYTTVKLLTTKESHNISEVITDDSQKLYIYDIDIRTLEENFTSSSNYEEVSGADKEEIIRYLMSENIELSDIYEHL